MDTSKRNELFYQYVPCVKWAIKKNWALIQALRLDIDDVYQDLSITALKAIEGYDPDKSTSMKTHVISRLQYEVRNLKARYRPYGLSGAITDNISVMSIEYSRSIIELEVPEQADFTVLEVNEALESLSPDEYYAVRGKMEGACANKLNKDSLNRATAKLSSFFSEIAW